MVIFTKEKMQKGFTLLELLVVIGVIGVLASVILASLGSARSRAADTAIKETLFSVRTQAQFYFDTYGSFGAGGPGYCPLTGGTESWAVQYDRKIQALLTDAQNKVGGTNRTACYSETTTGGWAIAVQLKSSSTKAWCVDYRNIAKEVTISSNDPRTAMSSVAPAQCN